MTSDLTDAYFEHYAIGIKALRTYRYMTHDLLFDLGSLM